MKLSVIMYPYEIFNLIKSWGMTHRAEESVNQKLLRMSQEFSILA